MATLERVSLRARFNLLFFTLLAGLLASLFVIDQLQEQQWTRLAETEQSERRILLRELLALRSEPTRQFANDYGKWDETFSFVSKPTAEFAHDNLEAALASFRLERLWIFKPDGDLIYSTAAPLGSLAPRAPLPVADLLQIFRRPTFSFFLRDPTGLYEIHGASIVPTTDNDRVTPPVGFILAAQRWDDKTLAQITPIAQGPLALQAPDVPLPADPHLVSLPLLGYDGKVTAQLTLKFSLTESSIVAKTDNYELATVIAVGLSGLLVIGFLLRRWILNPLDTIGQSLSDNRLEPLEPLLHRHDEVGRLAALVRQSSQQQSQLTQSLVERSRLSRDLHDGAIQAIYATGLGLASARSLITSDPSGAAYLLEQSRIQLNGVINGLRRSIAGLEPETDHNRPFSAALASLVQPSIGAPRAVFQIDDALAERLPLAHRAQLLQFAREAVSNALRHSLAHELQITLQARPAAVLFEISDNGIGFEPSRVPPGGRGLINLAARAGDLGGTFSLRSAPGTGTAVAVLLPHPP